MQVELAYGKTGLAVELPDQYQYQVLEAKSARALPDPDAVLENALESPVQLMSLRAIAKGKKTAAISVCDITRPVPNRMVLPHVLRHLEQAGIPRENVTVLIATGLHRPATEEEIREIIGSDLRDSLNVVNHDARDLSSHRYLGETASGIPVHIDERFMEADLHITLGFIEPHLMLGYSGGRKLIAPGLAAQETIKVIHSPKYMRDRRTSEGSIADNPLHRELLEIARMARHDFLIDVSLTRDRRIAAVFAGHPESAHRQGADFVAQTMQEVIEEPVDAVLTTCAGYPLDLTFYQTVKGITAAQHIVKPGGRILVISECAEGPGAPEFCEMLKGFSSDQGFLDHISTQPVVVDQWQLEKLAMVTTEKNVFYCTPGLPEEFRSTLWGRFCNSPEEGISALLDGLPHDARIAIIPEGPYVLAQLEPPVRKEVKVIA